MPRYDVERTFACRESLFAPGGSHSYSPGNQQNLIKLPNELGSHFRVDEDAFVKDLWIDFAQSIPLFLVDSMYDTEHQQYRRLRRIFLECRGQSIFRSRINVFGHFRFATF
jgi:hypothetical protein